PGSDGFRSERRAVAAKNEQRLMAGSLHLFKAPQHPLAQTGTLLQPRVIAGQGAPFLVLAVDIQEQPLFASASREHLPHIEYERAIQIRRLFRRERADQASLHPAGNWRARE